MSDYLLMNGVGTAVSVDDGQQEGAVDLAVQTLPEATALDGADHLPVYDTSETTHRRTLLSTLRTWLQNAFDSVYASAAHDHDGDYDALGAASGAVATHESTYAHGDIASNTAARHTHTNKATLDAIPDHAEVTEGYALVKGSGGGLAWAEQSGTGGGTDLDTVTVTFNGNGNTAGTVPGAIAQVVSHVVTLPLGTGLVDGDAAISEWNTAADGSGTSYTLGGKYTFTAATTLYAQYAAPITATGGTVTEADGYKIHTFTSDGTFEVTDAGSPGEVEYLIVAGGGSGGAGYAGGGGAGGMLTGETTVTAQSYTITVGDGGAATPSGAKLQGNDGEDSVALGFTAVGGGGGGEEQAGKPGGSGGGGGKTAEQSAGGSGTSGQGNSGGSSGAVAGAAPGGGGGGAGATGENGVGGTDSSATGGNGGSGASSSISGTATTYAGGGGGGIFGTSATPGSGGSGGGGSGGKTTAGTAGEANTGGGGGGGARTAAGEANNTGGGAGGSGIVIIRYPHPGA